MEDDDLVRLAAKVAGRSTIKRFHTGAVIYNRGTILSTGWSHVGEGTLARYRSTHAEQHAIAKVPASMVGGATLAIATVSAKSGNWTNACPCYYCLQTIKKAGISRLLVTAPTNRFIILDMKVVDAMEIVKPAADARKHYVDLFAY